MEAIGTLAGGVAHDFNNILTALIGYGALLQMGLGKDNPLRMYADQILSSSEKAAQLTQSLLTFSRKQPITLKPVKLNDVILGTEKLLKRLLTEDIVLETRLTPEDTTILGDATQVDQILFNLVTNARDAMSKGGKLIVGTKRAEIDNEFLRAHGYGETGTYVLISVSDTGAGMDEETKEHVFDPFFTTKEVGKGTGLGLSTVYGIVKQHNGYINVYSELNMGTAFHIYLPAVAAAVEEKKTTPFLWRRTMKG
jgi:signal transduction histidine kinase